MRSCLYKCPLLNCYRDESIPTPPLGTYCISLFMFVSYHVMRCKGRCCLLILALQTVAAETWHLTLREGGSALGETRLHCVIVLDVTHSGEWRGGMFQSLVFLACVNVLISSCRRIAEDCKKALMR